MLATRRPTFTKQQAIRRGYLVLENDTIVGTYAFVRRRGTAKSRLRISLFQNLRAAVLPLKWRHLIQIVKDTEPGTRIFAFTLPEKNAFQPILQKLGFGFASETRDEEDRVVWRWELAPAGK
jgi:hypothetical protein